MNRLVQFYPQRTMINAVTTPWSAAIILKWDEHVLPRFTETDTKCTDANYFTPRPYVDAYNRGSKTTGFTYTVQPGNRVCIVEWIDEAGG